ncbi:hypothetical protein QTP88_019113 [Uroleucon formosanum]
MVLSTSVVADDNREKALVHGGETEVQKLGCLFSNWSWSRFSVRLGQYQTSGEGDDDYADGDEEEPDDETGNASSSSIGAVVLEVEAFHVSSTDSLSNSFSSLPKNCLLATRLCKSVSLFAATKSSDTLPTVDLPHTMKPMPLRSSLPPAATRTAAPPGCTREDEASFGYLFGYFVGLVVCLFFVIASV